MHMRCTGQAIQFGPGMKVLEDMYAGRRIWQNGTSECIKQVLIWTLPNSCPHLILNSFFRERSRQQDHTVGVGKQLFNIDVYIDQLMP